MVSSNSRVLAIQVNGNESKDLVREIIPITDNVILYTKQIDRLQLVILCTESQPKFV